jgi:hypothetical protein
MGEGAERADLKGRMLPGIAAICLYMIFITVVNAFLGVKGVYGTGAGKYTVLTLCTLLAVGVYGLLRLRKWGWALVTAGSLLIATGYLIFFTRVHEGFSLVSGLLVLVFFLYLVRQETRARLR